MQPKETESAQSGPMFIPGFLRKAISEQISRIHGSELKVKIVRSIFTLGTGTVVEKSLKFLRNVILARLLAPDQFGLMAYVFVAGKAFEAFGEVGVKQSVIQNKLGADPAYLNAAWWIQAVRGLCLFLIAMLVAPWVSAFYEDPELLNLLRVSFLAILFRGLINPRAYVLEREYNFGRVVLLVQGGGVLGAAIAVGLAFVIRNVWALVIGFVAEPVITFILSYILVPFVPRFSIDRKCLKELIRFVRGIFGLPALVVLSVQLDVLVLGKVVSNDELGLYFLAMALTQLPVELFSRVMKPILLPTFALQQDDKKALCRRVLKAVRCTSLFGIPLTIFMASCAGGILLLAYGPGWVAVTLPFAMLSLHSLDQVEGAILASLYMAVGRPNLQRRFVILRLVILLCLIYPASLRWGLLGAAGVVCVANYVSLIMQAFWCRRVIDLPFGTYLRCYVPGLLLALPIVITVGLLINLGVESFVTLLIVGTVVFFLVCVLAFYLLQRPGVLAVEKAISTGNLIHASRVEVESG